MDQSPEKFPNPFTGWKREQVLWIVVVLLGLLLLAIWFLRLQSNRTAPPPTPSELASTVTPSPTITASTLPTLEELPYESTQSDAGMNPTDLAQAAETNQTDTGGGGPTETPTFFIRGFTTRTPTRYVPYTYYFSTATPYYYLTQYYNTLTAVARASATAYAKLAKTMGPTWTASAEAYKQTSTFIAYSTNIARTPRPQQVAYSSGGSIFVIQTTPMPLGTPQPTAIQVASGNSTMGEWAPDGRSFVYENGGVIYTQAVNLDGTVSGSPVSLPNMPAGPNVQPNWSHNRAWIVFVNQNADPALRGLYRINPAGNYLQRLTNNPDDEMPDWSPDSGRIAFVSTANGVRDLFYINVVAAAPYVIPTPVSGTPTPTATATPGIIQDRKQLTFSAETETWPRFSPDGRYLLFSRDDAGVSNLYILDLTSQFLGAPVLIPGAPGNLIDPSWSRTVSYFIYVANNPWSLFIQGGYQVGPTPIATPVGPDIRSPRWRP